MARIDRRTLLASGAAFLAAPHVARAQAPVTIKMGALKLIHSIAPHFYERFAPAGTKIEVIALGAEVSPAGITLARRLGVAAG